MPVAVVGAVTAENVVAAGHEVGKKAMPAYAGVDDSDGLAGPAGEPPHGRQVEALELPSAGGIVLPRRRGGGHALLPLLGGLRRGRRPRLRQQRIVERQVARPLPGSR